MSEDSLLAEIQPHLDAIRLFTQQAGTETSIAEADYNMVMTHLRALVDIAKELPDGPERQALTGVLNSFLELSENFTFVPIEDQD